MTARSSTETAVEDAAIAWLESLGCAVLHGPENAAEMSGAEPDEPNHRDVVLASRLCQATPDMPTAALRDTLLPKLISGALRPQHATHDLTGTP